MFFRLLNPNLLLKFTLNLPYGQKRASEEGKICFDKFFSVIHVRICFLGCWIQTRYSNLPKTFLKGEKEPQREVKFDLIHFLVWYSKEYVFWAAESKSAIQIYLKPSLRAKKILKGGELWFDQFSRTV